MKSKNSGGVLAVLFVRLFLSRMGDIFLTPAILLATAFLLSLFALGAGGCLVLRLVAVQRHVLLEMPGSWVTDGLQVLLYTAAVVWLLRYRRRLQRLRRGLCVNCGDDLRGNKQRCPKCGTPIILRGAVKWWRRAAEQGIAVAQFNLGRCYALGEGVEKDKSEAVIWLRKAAEQGHADAEEALKMIDEQSHFHVLTSSVWTATPSDYSSCRFLTFKTDGTGELTYGYGQTIYANIKCRFELVTPSLIQWTYLDSPARTRFKGFVPTDANRIKRVPYKLKQADVSGVETVVAKPFTFQWTLELACSPFPEGLPLPHEVPLVYFGDRQKNA